MKFKKVVNNTKFFIMKTQLNNWKNKVGGIMILFLSLFFSVNVFSQCTFPTGCDDVALAAVIGSCDATFNLPNPSTDATNGSCAVGAIYLHFLNDVDVSGDNTLAGSSYTLPVGVHTLIYSIPDGDDAETDIDDQCTFAVEVSETGVNTIACNDQIQVTLNSDCEVFVTPDMVMEGDACYNYYTLEVEDAAGNELPFTAFDDVPNPDVEAGTYIDAPGTYAVTVISPFGLRCWSSIVVEDKIPLALNCGNFDVYCSQDDLPGSALNLACEVETFALSTTVDDTTFYDLTFTPVDGSSINRIELLMNITIEDVSTLKAILVDPNGVEREVFDLTSTFELCHEGNLDIVFSDDGTLPNSNFNSAIACGQGISVAFCGSYEPADAFSIYNGTSGVGVWELQLVNSDATDNPVTAFESTLSAEFYDLTIPFPTDGSWTLNSDGTYSLDLANNCGPYLATYVDEDVENSDCDVVDSQNTMKQKVRTWTVFGPAAASSTCQQFITVLRWDPDPVTGDIFWPKSYDGQAGNFPALSCRSLFKENDPTGAIDPTFINPVDTVPTPALTGRPYAKFGSLERCGNIQFNYTDTKFRINCTFTFKVLRKWTALDWCTGEIHTYDQIIKVTDNEGPVVTCQTDFREYSTDPYECKRDLALPVPYNFGDQATDGPLVTFECGRDTWTYEVEYLFDDEVTECTEECSPPESIAGFVNDNVYRSGTATNGLPIYSISDVPKGCSWIRYVFTDECGNETECRTEIRVVDDIKPSPVCIEYTVATFDESGCANIYAYSFDNESWDNCQVLDFRARELNSNDDYQSELQFCCADGYYCDEEIMIELIVFDGDLGDDLDNLQSLSNVPECINYNNCMVRLSFQDKIPPYFDNSPGDLDTILDCDADAITEQWLRDNFKSRLLPKDNLDHCNPLDPVVSGTLPFAHDGGCDGASRSYTWTIDDGCGNTATYTQRVNFGNADELEEDDINWPDYVNPILVDCADLDDSNGDPLSPAAIQAIGGYAHERPNASDVDCSVTAITYDDQYFPDVDDDGVCAKILRTWVVIDWCAYDASTGAGEFTRTQIIKLIDTDAPNVNAGVNVTCDDMVYNTDDNECEPFVKILLSASDMCTATEDLEWVVFVYKCSESATGTADEVHYGPSISDNYSHGYHTILVQVTDACGNVTERETTFLVEDCRTPTPYCIAELVITMDQGSGQTGIWASDFDQGSVDDCGNCSNYSGGDLIFAFNEDATENESIIYTCDEHFPNGESTYIDTLDMWVIDGNGNGDFCTVVLIVQNNNACEGTGGNSRVEGTIMSELNETVDLSMVTLTSTDPISEFPVQVVTGADGEFDFTNVPSGHSFVIDADKDSDIKNGVSTIDIVRIQRHIMGITNLDSPYKLIAADANNSSTISAGDIATIRRVILGVITEFPNGQDSWRVIDANQTFSNNNAPFPFSEVINIDNLSGNMSGQDFMAIKIGDVDNSAELSAGTETEVRSSVVMTSDNVALTAGELVSIPMSIGSMDEILGLQFSLQYDVNLMDIESIESGLLTIDESNLGFASEGVMTFSWNEVTPTKITNEDVLFTINARAKAESNVQEALVINSRVTSAEVYNENLQPSNITFELRNGDLVSNGYDLLQNVPNPFESETTISFVLPSASAASLTVFDVNGKVVQKVVGDYEKGMNNVSFDASTFGTSGILYYQLETDKYTSTKKMIYLK